MSIAREPAPIAWRRAPIDRRGLAVMIAVFVVATAVLVIVGLAIVHWWDTSTAGRADADLNRWLERHRTDRLDALADHVARASDPLTKVLLGVVLAPLFVWLFRRWHEYALIIGGLLLEVCIFGLSSEIVARDRPPVEQLDGAPTNSFPSGHIAAAVVFYTGLAVVIFMRTRRRWARAIGVAIGVVVPLAVLAARLYQGMHYATDAVAGLLLGVTTLVVMRRVIQRTLPPDERPELHDAAGGPLAQGEPATVALAT